MMLAIRGDLRKQWSEWQIDSSDDQLASYAETVVDSWSSQARPWLPDEAVVNVSKEGSRFDLIENSIRGRQAREFAAFAFVESITGRKARCLVEISGTGLPVDLPLRLIEAHKLQVGDRFLWWMSADGSVSDQDIDDLPHLSHSVAEQKEADMLYEKHLIDLASGASW